MQDWDHARIALQSIKDIEIGRANRRMEETKFQVGDLVLVRVFTVNRTQLNEGGAFANRWAGPCKVIEQVAHQSYRLELPIRAASRMGRVFNAIELKPYQLRRAADAERALRGALRDRTNRDDFPDPNAPDVIDLDAAGLSPDHALPRCAPTDGSRGRGTCGTKPG